MKTRILVMAASLCVFFLVVALSNGVPTAKAASEEQIEQAITNGLEWLATEQNFDGSWGSYEEVAHTGFAVLKMEDRAFELGMDPFDSTYEYSGNITNGLNYIFTQIQADGSITTNAHHANYNTAIAVMAISGSRHPEMEVSPGVTYGQVVQNAVDYLIAGQNSNGGWGYNIADAVPGGWTDNSNSGYVTLGLVAAQNLFGVDISAVLPSLNNWIDLIQDDVDGDLDDGGSYYCPDWFWVNILKTGNLLFQMAMVGDTTGVQRVQDAIDYIERHWNDANQDPGWRNNYQAMYTMMKGFVAQGVETIEVGGSDIDWFDEVSTVIVTTQNPDGSWPVDIWGNSILTTSWALLALERVVEVPRQEVYVDFKPGSCPNSFNVKNNGVLPVAVLGTEDFDVTTIDPETIKLTREPVDCFVQPIRWSYEDVATPFEGELCDCHDLNGDGYMDLTLKFDTQELVNCLALEEVAGETIPLTLTGNLKEEDGGTPITGEDCLRVLNLGGGKK